MQYFRRPLEERFIGPKPLITKQEIKLLFANSTQLLEENRKFLALLKDVFSDYNDETTCITRAFINDVCALGPCLVRYKE